MAPALPIDDVLPELRAALRIGPNAVLVAPPGAGKTTRTPLALLDEPWLDGRRLILLEPRRLAARAAAARMAASLGETIGATVGLRVRMETRVGPRTRIEVVTEGVFSRMILDDPMLSGVGGVLFDEFHERSLDADFGLALALDAQSALREDLRILVMSATLDGARVAALISASGRVAPVIESAGRAHPVETRYLGRSPDRPIEDQTARAIMRALREDDGSILVFLPGRREIARTAGCLGDPGADVDVVALHGALDPREQDRAIAPTPAGRRKVVLATSIAETSLTIEGVRIVIDSGLSRIPVFEPDIGVTRLETVRASRAACEQRRGRAGRTAPGICYRLWEEAENGGLAAYAPPEILSADLAGLLMECIAWGESDPTRLRWLDPPPAPSLEEARRLLRYLGAVDAEGRLTASGAGMRRLPLPPRLAHMVAEAARRGAEGRAAEIAAIIVERGVGGDSPDIEDRLRELARDRSRRAEETRALAAAWARMASEQTKPVVESGSGSIAALVALAFPERIAKSRGQAGEFLMANGRGLRVEPTSRLASAPFLAVAEISGKASATRALLAAALDPSEFDQVAGERVIVTDETVFDPATRGLRRRRRRRLGAIILEETPLSPQSGAAATRALAEGAASIGVANLPWTQSQRALRSRVAFLRAWDADASWPDLSDAALAARVADWLAPIFEGATSFAELRPERLDQALSALLPWPLSARLDAEAPSHFLAPTGARVPIDYAAEAGPLVSIRVQELFGLRTHPTVLNGRVPLAFELLSPARRPIQTTRDLPGFWRGSWAAVKSEMKGRYPRHPWPDDPAAASATTRAKPRGT